VVEQEIVNLFVGGSNPSSGATKEDIMEESKTWKLSKAGPPSENGYVISDKNAELLKETFARIGAGHE
jgi:hypothetical protein